MPTFDVDYDGVVDLVTIDDEVLALQPRLEPSGALAIWLPEQVRLVQAGTRRRHRVVPCKRT